MKGGIGVIKMVLLGRVLEVVKVVGGLQGDVVKGCVEDE